MSKSLGNFVDLNVMKRFSDHYGLDGLRYYLLTEGPVGSQDANFSACRVHEVYSTDLANTLGNSLSRTTAMINKYYSEGAFPRRQTQRENGSLGVIRLARAYSRGCSGCCPICRSSGAPKGNECSYRSGGEGRPLHL